MNVLLLDQAIDLKYLDLLSEALGTSSIYLLTGNVVSGTKSLEVIRAPEYDSKNIKTRLMSWISYYRFVKKWSKKNKSLCIDLIIATSNPPINSFMGLKVKKMFSARFIYINWDIYPDILLKRYHNPIVILLSRFWLFLNNRYYPQIDKVVTIGKVMSDSIKSSIKNTLDLDVIPFATDTLKMLPIDKRENPFAIGNNLSNKFIVLYSGKIGEGHNISLILKGAKLLEKYPDICFVFIGKGSQYSVVQKHIETRGSSNVVLFPFQPPKMFPYSMAIGDIGIVSQESRMSHLFFPSKVYDMMSCGLAIIGICSENDDLSNLIRDYNIGEIVSDNNAETLAQHIESLYLSHSKINHFKAKSRVSASVNILIKVLFR